MFEFLPNEKREIILRHPELGGAFFSRQIDKNTFLDNLKEFTPSLCYRRLGPKERFTPQEINRITKEIKDYPKPFWRVRSPAAEPVPAQKFPSTPKIIGKSGQRITLRRPIGGQSLQIEIAIHPYLNGIIILNYPGITGDIDGYNNKYGQLADFVREKRIGTVVRMGNPVFEQLPYPQTMIDNFKYVVEYCLSHGKELSGNGNPTLYLMGFSAGASTVAAVSGDYPSVKKILLIAPSGDVGQNAVTRGLGNFRGEVYITVGQNDEIVGPGAGKTFYNLARTAKLRKLVVIPNCDHQFRGERNGKIMSKCPLWAFAGDKTFPSPESGRRLYV